MKSAILNFSKPYNITFGMVVTGVKPPGAYPAQLTSARLPPSSGPPGGALAKADRIAHLCVFAAHAVR